MPEVAQRISIEATGLGGRGQRYRVTHNGVPLIESTKNPEFDSARALLARGIVGQVEVWRHGVSFPASRFDVGRAANVTVSETDRDGLRITRWQPATKEDDQTRAVWSEYNPRAATDDCPQVDPSQKNGPFWPTPPTKFELGVELDLVAEI